MSMADRKAMSRVEVVVDRGLSTVRDLRFVEWLEGWLRMRHKVFGAYLRNFRCDVFYVEADMFELVAEVYKVVQFMRWRLGARVPVVVCSDDGCIDLSEEDGLMSDLMFLVPSYEVEKLERVRDEVKKMVKNVKGVSMSGEGGRVWFYLDDCKTYVYVDEAVVLSGILLDKLYEETGQEVFRELRDVVFEVFNLGDVELDVNVGKMLDKIYVELNGCVMFLTHEEVLDIIDGLLTLSITYFKESAIIANENWGYEWD
jgi:hypothetical protein